MTKRKYIARGCLSLALATNHSDVGSPLTAPTRVAFDGELDLLALPQVVEGHPSDAARMKEILLSLVRADEPEPTFAHEPLDASLCHARAPTPSERKQKPTKPKGSIGHSICTSLHLRAPA
jgi:hypothetical protein